MPGKEQGIIPALITTIKQIKKKVMTVNIFSEEDNAIELEKSFSFWQNIKAKYTDAIILIRHENEYFTFDKDAEVLAAMLNMELQTQDEKLMCNIPHHYTDWLLPKLVKSGY